LRRDGTPDATVARAGVTAQKLSHLNLLPLAPRTVREVERLWREQFGAVSDVIRSAARIPPDRTIAPERMRAACAYGLEEIFGAG
jgi:hypothetical protein